MGSTATVTSISPGSAKWASKMRKRASELAKTLDTGYVEMGQILWDAYNTPVNGDPRKCAIYQSWGYDSFGDYVEKELGMHRRKAERLRNIGQMLSVHLAGIDPETKQRIVSLGWSKLRELTRIWFQKADKKTVNKWLDLAEKSSYPQLLHAIGKALDKKEAAVKPKKLHPVTDEEGNDLEVDDEEDELDEDEEDELANVDMLPEVEEAKAFHFYCFGEQIANVDAALERAEELSESDVKSNNLSLIALDFLATNDFGKKADPKMIQRYLGKFEQLLGIRLVAFKKGECVFGLNTLQDMAGDDE